MAGTPSARAAGGYRRRLGWNPCPAPRTDRSGPVARSGRGTLKPDTRASAEKPVPLRPWAQTDRRGGMGMARPRRAAAGDPSPSAASPAPLRPGAGRSDDPSRPDPPGPLPIGPPKSRGRTAPRWRYVARDGDLSPTVGPGGGSPGGLLHCDKPGSLGPFGGFLPHQFFFLEHIPIVYININVISSDIRRSKQRYVNTH